MQPGGEGFATPNPALSPTRMNVAKFLAQCRSMPDLSTPAAAIVVLLDYQDPFLSELSMGPVHHQRPAIGRESWRMWKTGWTASTWAAASAMALSECRESPQFY